MSIFFLIFTYNHSMFFILPIFLFFGGGDMYTYIPGLHLELPPPPPPPKKLSERLDWQENINNLALKSNTAGGLHLNCALIQLLHRIPESLKNSLKCMIDYELLSGTFNYFRLFSFVISEITSAKLIWGRSGNRNVILG